MKTIKEYINESLFDSENDLLDKTPTDAIIEWFDENVKFINCAIRSTRIPARDVLSVNNGLLTVELPIGTCIDYYAQPPKWIKFDEKSWGNTFSYVCYDVTSQKDIERIPMGGEWTYNKISKQ